MENSYYRMVGVVAITIFCCILIADNSCVVCRAII
ncbi:putative membrane protein, partial [Bacteroides fragilis str. 3986 N(B)19]